MRDRQYFSSLTISVVAAAAVLAGIVVLVLWLNWGGAVGLLTALAVFLAWFYRGPRPEFAHEASGDEIAGAGRE